MKRYHMVSFQLMKKLYTVVCSECGYAVWRLLDSSYFCLWFYRVNKPTIVFKTYLCWLFTCLCICQLFFKRVCQKSNSMNIFRETLAQIRNISIILFIWIIQIHMQISFDLILSPIAVGKRWKSNNLSTNKIEKWVKTVENILFYWFKSSDRWLDTDRRLIHYL